LQKIPHKRHTIFKNPDGSLNYEQLFGTIGFDGMYSNLYHEHSLKGSVKLKGVKSEYYFSAATQS